MKLELEGIAQRMRNAKSKDDLPGTEEVGIALARDHHAIVSWRIEETKYAANRVSRALMVHGDEATDESQNEVLQASKALKGIDQFCDARYQAQQELFKVFIREIEKVLDRYVPEKSVAIDLGDLGDIGNRLVGAITGAGKEKE